MSPPTMPPTSTNDVSLRLSERPFQRLHDQTATAYPLKMSDPIQKRFLLRLVMAITANLQPESGRIVYAGSDFPHPFQPRFSKEGMDHIVQNRPGSDLDGLVRVWLNAYGLETRWCAGISKPGFCQNATGPLPVSHFQTRFCSSTDVPDNIV